MLAYEEILHLCVCSVNTNAEKSHAKKKQQIKLQSLHCLKILLIHVFTIDVSTTELHNLQSKDTIVRCESWTVFMKKLQKSQYFGIENNDCQDKTNNDQRSVFEHIGVHFGASIAIFMNHKTEKTETNQNVEKFKDTDSYTNSNSNSNSQQTTPNTNTSKGGNSDNSTMISNLYSDLNNDSNTQTQTQTEPAPLRIDESYLF